MTLSRLLRLLVSKVSFTLRPFLECLCCSHSRSFHNICKVAQWYKASAVEVSDGEWAINPSEGLCQQCGYGIDAILTEPEHEGKTHTDIIEEVVGDRPLKAKILLLHDIQSGKLPKGFTACVV